MRLRNNDAILQTVGNSAQAGRTVFRVGGGSYFNPLPLAWLELNYRPHAYQAASYEHELGSEVPTRLPFTNILLSFSRIHEDSARLREHFARLNGHHNGHH